MGERADALVANILSPASGQPITVPTQDMVLGLYYLTKAKPGAKGEGRAFAGIDEVLLALEAGEVETLSPIRLRYSGEVIDLTTAYDDQDVTHTEPVNYEREFPNTTVDAILNDHLPEGMPYINGLLKKKGIGQLVNYGYLQFGPETTVKMLDEIKSLGFRFAARAGLSIGIDDMVIRQQKSWCATPRSRWSLSSGVFGRHHERRTLQRGHRNLVGDYGRSQTKCSATCRSTTRKAQSIRFTSWPIQALADRNSRSVALHIVVDAAVGRNIETPITANFHEGLTVLQYFTLTHGARKGLADTALKTADSGYLTRRPVDVAQDVIISEYDCGTVDGIYVSGIVEAGEIIEPLRDRIVGRVSLEKIKDYDGNVIVDINNEITEELAGAIQAAGIER